jgi:hypothetical protein
MGYVHPDEMTQEERERLTREAKVSIARLRLRYYKENPKVKRGAAYDEAVRVVAALS